MIWHAIVIWAVIVLGYFVFLAALMLDFNLN
jgi:hypothetical protein